MQELFIFFVPVTLANLSLPKASHTAESKAIFPASSVRGTPESHGKGYGHRANGSDQALNAVFHRKQWTCTSVSYPTGLFDTSIRLFPIVFSLPVI